MSGGKGPSVGIHQRFGSVAVPVVTKGNHAVCGLRRRATAGPCAEAAPGRIDGVARGRCRALPPRGRAWVKPQLRTPFMRPVTRIARRLRSATTASETEPTLRCTCERCREPWDAARLVTGGPAYRGFPGIQLGHDISR